MTKTMCYTDIDFDKNGKQIGFLNLPTSENDDGWGVLRVPLTVIKNGVGPTVILEGGNHGDEYEGPIILGELIRELDPARLSGRLIIVPAINVPAVVAGQRVSPFDGLNFNRTFPGNPFGSQTQQLSSYVNDVLFPLADAFIDLHSGGSSLSIVPSAIIELASDPALQRRNNEAVAAFGAPMTVVVSNRGDPRTATASAVRAGLVTVGTEMAGMGTVSLDALKICRRGVRNILDHFGVLENDGQQTKPSSRSTPYEIAGHAAYVLATDDGVFEPYHALGAEVKSGDKAGRIHFLADPCRSPTELFYAADGVIYGRRHPGRVKPGNCCVVVASLCSGFSA